MSRIKRRFIAINDKIHVMAIENLKASQMAAERSLNASRENLGILKNMHTEPPSKFIQKNPEKPEDGAEEKYDSFLAGHRSMSRISLKNREH